MAKDRYQGREKSAGTVEQGALYAGLQDAGATGECAPIGGRQAEVHSRE